MQGRLNFTTEILASIKSIKMIGLAEMMTSNIERLRDEELEVSKKYRLIHSVNVLHSEFDV